MDGNSKYRIFFLGPEYSFTHEAAKKAVKLLIKTLSKQGEKTLKPEDFELVSKSGNEEIESGIRVDSDAFAVIPISNSKQGDVYRFLPFCSYEKVAEFRIPINLCLCSHSTLKNIRKLATMIIAYGQVKNVVDKLLPNNVDCSTYVNSDISTSEAAEMAVKDPTIAAICSQKAARHYGIPILINNLDGKTKKETTFYIFRNTSETHFSPPPKIASEFNFLIRGAHIYSGKHLNAGREAFAELLMGREKLSIKWGVDPIYESLHLGHLSNLLKLRDFLSFEHKITVVLGNFTGIIADPSGNLTQRPPIDGRKLDRNCKKILNEIEKILGKDTFDIVYNQDLIKDFDLRKFLEWMRSTDIRCLIDRPDFKNRLDFAHPLSAAEFIYPMFQAFDTVYVKPDIEIGGADQIWNGVLCKDIMKQEGLKVPLILLVDTLRGIDGSPKMNSFEGNAILFSDSKEEIKKKIMNMPVSLLYSYYISLTRIDIQEISNMKAALINGQIDEKKWKEGLVKEILILLKKK